MSREYVARATGLTILRCVTPNMALAKYRCCTVVSQRVKNLPGIRGTRAACVLLV